MNYILFLLALLLSSPVMAQNSTGATSVDNFYSIDDFSGGLKSHVTPYLVSKNSATIAQNVRFNSRFGALVKRPKMLQLSACRAFAVKSLYRYYKSDATKYSIETSSTFMDTINDTTGACTNLATGLSDSKRWTWITYKDVAIGTNGTDRAKKWDGKTQSTANTDASRTAGDLVADLGAPFAEQNTGSALDASSWYQYKVAFYDGTTYKFSNARSNPLLTGSSVRDITLTDIPLGPTGTTARVIYRTVGDASRAAVIADTSFYKVATISDNTTRTYNDSIDDGTILADAAPTWATASAGINVTPPYAKYSLIHKERLFFANDPSGTVSGKSTMYWSDTLNPDYFNFNTDYEVIRPDDGDQITTIKNNPAAVIIGKEGTWSKLYTDASSDSSLWSISAPLSFIGCIAPYSAVDSPQGILYLGRHGIYSFNGSSSSLVSDVVTDKVRDILATNQTEVAGIYYDNQYLLSYTSSSTGSGYNDRVLILDVTRNNYVEDTKNVDSWASFDSGTDFGTLYSGSSTTDGKVYAHSGSFNDLVYRYKSQFDLGVTSDTVVRGTQEEPYLTLGWGQTWEQVSGAWNAQGSSTWLVKALSGTWTSPAIQISATTLDKIYWNENLGSYGNVTFAVRLASSEGGISGASWSSEYSSPSGSDISGLTANTWIQIRATLTSSVYTETPELYLEDSFVFHMTYQQDGSSTAETAILSVWKSGFTEMGSSEHPNRIKEIQVYYEGTSGTLTMGFENDSGTTNTFDINLSVTPSASTTDAYFGNATEKIYAYIPLVGDNVNWNGRKWRISVSEGGATEFKINRIVVRTDVGSYVTFKK